MWFITNLFSEFNIYTVFLRILLSVLLGGLIGSERGRHGRAAGLRTHILVCVGAAITSLTSVYLSDVLGYKSDIARLSAQVISGIGFLCAGTILIRNSSVITGLTTAAGMWATASIGVAIGYGFYSGAILATLACIFSIMFLSRFETIHKKTVNLYIEISNIDNINDIIKTIKENERGYISFDIISAKSGIANNVGIICNLINDEYCKILTEKIKKYNGVSIVVSDINI